MTELKCPFCGHILGRKNTNDIMCSNEKCATWKGNFYGSEELWQELIRTRKALEIAKDTLHWYDDNYDSIVAKESINEITELEQKEVK